MSNPVDRVVGQPGEWLRGEGPLHDIVISSRIRLARNISGFPFLSRADLETRGEIAETIGGAIEKSDSLREFLRVNLEELDELDGRLLVERQLISRQHAEGRGARCVAFDAGEACSLMINEEDHLRIQVIRSGMQLDDIWQRIDAIDDSLDKHLDFAFHAQFGFLTACPTNVGTGIRVSVMLHLPALRMTEELEKVGQAAKDLKLAVRGLYGEGTEALGDFFQISNQITLGRAETEIIDDFRDVVIPKIVEYERRARQKLLDDHRAALDDRIFRAIGTLRHARLMSSTEAFQYLSQVRMGVHTGRIKDLELRTINELFLLVQPAHLQKLGGKRLSGEQRSLARADLIRARLGEN